MASLMKKLFATLPLTGVEHAVYDVSTSPANATIGKMRRHVGFHRSPLKRTVDTRRPSESFLDKLEGRGGRIRNRWDLVEIWGWDARGEPNRLDRVTCRVRDDHFNQYLVLDRLEWGYAPNNNPTSFRPAVLIDFKGSELELPLTDEYRLMTFTTAGGRIQPKVNTALWPMEQRHDRSILHVFAYDIVRTSKAILPLTAFDHPQKDEVDAMLARCEELNGMDYKDDRPHTILFEDDLWDTSLSKNLPLATVPEDVDLSLNAVRVLVACSLTTCRERDDYQPGAPMGVGRMFPHVMVISTAPLTRIDAGVRLTRPKRMTLLDAEHCECSEMLSEIHGLLVSDSNTEGMVLHNIRVVASAPHIYLANFFSYDLPDPISDPDLAGKLIPLVERSKQVDREKSGDVMRDCTDIQYPSEGAFVGQQNNTRVVKRRRQGQFDNLHLAPQMAVRDVFDRAIVSRPGVFTHDMSVPFKSYQDWKMDAVPMAPFCAHDCFHMHWRWSDNLNDQETNYGWGVTTPHVVCGVPLVPENQDVWLMVLSNHAVSYLAQAHDVPKDMWQPFCHHGAGYGLSSGEPIKLAKMSAAMFDGITFMRGGETVVGDWALLYWRLRYRFKIVKKIDAAGNSFYDGEVEERFSFRNKMGALET